jgi:hypothetical protein
MGSLLGPEVLGDHRSFLGVKAMLLTTIVVTGIVFTMIGAAIGYILGFIEAENHYKIKHGDKPRLSANGPRPTFAP